MVYEQRLQRNHPLTQRRDPFGQTALELTERSSMERPTTRLDQVADRLGLHQIELAP